jgi:hypothetical protein
MIGRNSNDPVLFGVEKILTWDISGPSTSWSHGLHTSFCWNRIVKQSLRSGEGADMSGKAIDFLEDWVRRTVFDDV